MDLKHYEAIKNTADSELELSTLRDGIDEIDQSLLDLLIKRLEIVEKVGAYKQSREVDSEVVIRPGREARIFRELIKQSNEQYSPQVLVRIWRSIISSSVSVEQSLRVLAHTPDKNMTAYWLAHDYFGVSMPITVSGDSRSILEDCTRDTGIIAFFGDIKGPEKWWKDLAELRKDNDLFVFVKVPLVPSVIDSPQLVSASQEGYAVGHIQPESSGKDQSLWVIESESSWKELIQLFDTHHCEIQLIDQTEGTWLVACPDFSVSATEGPMSELQSEPSISSLVCIGAYAVDLFDVEGE